MKITKSKKGVRLWFRGKGVCERKQPKIVKIVNFKKEVSYD